MKLHFERTCSVEEYKNNPQAKDALELNKAISVYCQFYSEGTSVKEPVIWVYVNGRYDVWRLKDQTILKGTKNEEEFKTLCNDLLKNIYNNGFANGDFE